MGLLSSFRRDMKGGTDAYRQLVQQRGAWVNEQMGDTKVPDWGYTSANGPDNNYVFTQADADAIAKQKKLMGDWLGSLDPATRAQAEAEFGLHSSDIGTVNKVGKTAALGTIAAAAGGAALTGSGLLGGGVTGGATSAPGLTGVDAAMADLAASGGLTPASMGGATAGAGAGGGLLSSLPAGVTEALGTAGTAGKSLLEWAAKNPGAIASIGGLLAGAGAAAGNKNPEGEPAYPAQPGLSFGALKPQTPMNQSAGTFTPAMNARQSGMANSGLARFGAKAGTYNPLAYKPTNFNWV